MFLRDLEEDEEMRGAINLYKTLPKKRDPSRMEVESDAGESTDWEDENEDIPKSERNIFSCETHIDQNVVNPDELIDEMAVLTINEEEESLEEE